jgi:hypothetical protein
VRDESDPEALSDPLGEHQEILDLELDSIEALLEFLVVSSGSAAPPSGQAPIV